MQGRLAARCQFSAPQPRRAGPPWSVRSQPGQGSLRAVCAAAQAPCPDAARPQLHVLPYRNLCVLQPLYRRPGDAEKVVARKGLPYDSSYPYRGSASDTCAVSSPPERRLPGTFTSVYFSASQLTQVRAPGGGGGLGGVGADGGGGRPGRGGGDGSRGGGGGGGVNCIPPPTGPSSLQLQRNCIAPPGHLLGLLRFAAALTAAFAARGPAPALAPARLMTTHQAKQHIREWGSVMTFFDVYNDFL